jgi:hypothetical protein
MEGVVGALELADGRKLSWSWDTTLRLWDRIGRSLEVYKWSSSTPSTTPTSDL